MRIWGNPSTKRGITRTIFGSFLLFGIAIFEVAAQAQTDSAAARRAVQECAKALVSELSQALAPRKAGVVEIAGKTVKLDAGSQAGIYEGMQFDIVNGADNKAARVGRVQAVTVQANETLCEIVKQEAAQTLAAGQLAFAVVPPRTVGVAGFFGPVLMRPSAMSASLGNEFSDAMAGALLFNKVMSRRVLQEWVGPGVTAETRQPYELSYNELSQRAALKTLGDNAKVDCIAVGAIEPSPDGFAITARIFEASSGATLAVAKKSLATQQVESLMPGALLYEDKLLEEDDQRQIVAGAWKIADFNGVSALIPSGTGTNVTMINTDWGDDYVVSLHHNGEHQTAWNETLFLQWQDASNWTGVRFAGDAAFLVGMVKNKLWTAPGAKLNVADKGGRGECQLEAVVAGGTFTITANGKGITHRVAPLPAYVGLGCIGNTDTQATIPSVWRIRSLKISRPR